jgi:hypothetical protein
MSHEMPPLSPSQIAELLGATVPALRAELARLPEPLRRWHPAPGEWCAKEVVGHLVESERRGFAGRVRAILAGDDPRLPANDPDAVARARHDCDRDWAALVDELAGLRDASLALIEGLSDADLARGGQHTTVGFLRVGDLLQEWVYHDRNHVRQIMANVQAFVWPHMANAQRFYRT